MDAMSTERIGKIPAKVAEPRPAGETNRASAPWVESSVWTDRMWTALQDGVRGGRWHSLSDKVWKRKNLENAFRKVSRNGGCPGIDHVTVQEYGRRIDKELDGLEWVLRENRYGPQMLLRKYIPKEAGGGNRPLSIPTVRDRVVQTAIKQVIEPIYEQTFHGNSYGFRPNRSNKDALRKVVELLKNGHLYVVDADISKCFDTIPHAPLMERVGEKVSDKRLLGWIGQLLGQGIMEAGSEWEPEEGTPQGGPLSPLLANIYLNPVDWVLEEHGHTSVRFADDMVILCRSREEADGALDLLRRWMRQNGLELSEAKTHTVDMSEPKAYFDFLGYRFYRTERNNSLRWFARPKSVQKLRSKIRPKTKRCNGHSLEAIVRRINPILRGWFEYFKHSVPSMMEEVDRWVRMRLRSILRKRSKRRGRGRGSDHQQWPNAYFRELGLFSLTVARADLCSSAQR